MELKMVQSVPHNYLVEAAIYSLLNQLSQMEKQHVAVLSELCRTTEQSLSGLKEDDDLTQLVKDHVIPDSIKSIIAKYVESTPAQTINIALLGGLRQADALYTWLGPLAEQQPQQHANEEGGEEKNITDTVIPE